MENSCIYTSGLDNKLLSEIENIMQKIFSQLAIDRYLDYQSSVLLCRMFQSARRKLPDLSNFIGKPSVIIGPYNLSGGMPKIDSGTTVIVAGSSVENYNLPEPPAFIVTDLDGNLEKLFSYSGTGSTVVLHAHGDNIPRIIDYFSKIKGPIIPSCQVYIHPPANNFGGFTDGDRSVFFANFLGSPQIDIYGFNLEDPIAKSKPLLETKRKKLKFAGELIGFLETYRSRTYGDQNITFHR